MVCKVARSKLFPYMDGELPEEQAFALESHLAACPDCQRLGELERSFRKITGNADPTINDGQNVTQVTVGASDALFLIGSDQIAPANVGDLHRVP